MKTKISQREMKTKISQREMKPLRAGQSKALVEHDSLFNSQIEPQQGPKTMRPTRIQHRNPTHRFRTSHLLNQPFTASILSVGFEICLPLLFPFASLTFSAVSTLSLNRPSSLSSLCLSRRTLLFSNCFVFKRIV